MTTVSLEQALADRFGPPTYAIFFEVGERPGYPSRRADGGEVVLCTETTDGDGHGWATAMAPDVAEEMAHALLLCAAAARGRGVRDGDRETVARWILR